MTKELSRYDLWYGRPMPPGEMRALQAGPLSVVLDGGDLRYIRHGDVELVRRIYVAVRDLNWNTLPAEVTNLRVVAQDVAFDISFDCHHQAGDIDFTWRGHISGNADGSIRYVMDGQAGTNFAYAKIGICIHHPIHENAGRAYAGQTPAGPVSGTLPQTIGPQVHLPDGTDLPLFPPVDALRIQLPDESTVHFAFEGDLFEMEDQRNWTDASFKTASTPASLGYVHHARAGQTIRQSVIVWHDGAAGSAPVDGASTRRETRVTLGPPLPWPRPSLGLGMASHGGALTPREITLLQRLRLAHLRVDLQLADPLYRAALQRALAASRALHCALEVALFLPAHEAAAIAALDDLAAGLRDNAISTPRILVFRDGDEVAAGHWVQVVRERLHPHLSAAIFVGGTNIYFNELNRNRPDIAAMDGVTYSINPQIHAFDEASLTEALEGQGETVHSARAFSDALPLVISPVTFKPRFNAVASVPEGARAGDQLPAQVDPRQMSLFGAAWTLGSIKRLAESGVASITYYETTGWRGVMETEEGSPPQAPFPSQPGMVFPLYYVFADLAELPRGRLREATSSDPLSVTALAMEQDGCLCILIANMSPRERQVAVGPLPAREATLRRLNDETARLAIADPAAFLAMTTQVLPIDQDGLARITLAPFEYARIDTPL